MKKFTILLVSIFCLILFCGFDEDQTKVYDYANLLSQEEIDTLQGEAFFVGLTKTKRKYTIMLIYYRKKK